MYWKYALPSRLVYNFGCLSLKIVKSAFHWRGIFAFVASWLDCCDHDGVPWIYLSRFRSSSGQRCYHTKLRFCLPFLARPLLEKSFLKKGKKKKSICYISFFKSIFLSLPPQRSLETGWKVTMLEYLRGRVGQVEIVCEEYWLKSIIQKMNECMNFLY